MENRSLLAENNKLKQKLKLKEKNEINNEIINDKLDSQSSHNSVFTNGIDNANPVYRTISNLPSNMSPSRTKITEKLESSA